MKYPLVSCLMPTKNRRAFWPRTFKMFEAQDYPNKELIILEDGDSREKGDGYLGIGSGFAKYIRFEGTLGAKLNKGAELASGSICLNWDDDDWNSPTRISDQVRHMQLSGKPVAGMSSLIFYAEGQPEGWEYTGDAWYASGSTHCYTRDYILAHPRPDKTVGEDNDWILEAHQLNAVSTLSGIRSLVACDHRDNCSARIFGTELYQLIRETSDNFRRVPLSEFAETIGPYGSH